MKNSLNLIVVMLVTIGLSACGGSGGGGSSSPAPAVAAAGNTTLGYVGFRTWSGVLQGNGSQQYMMMAGQLGGGYSPNLDLQITTYNGGQMPGQVGVTLGYNYQFYAQASMSGNEFVATYFGSGGGFYGGGGYYPGQTYPGSVTCAPGYPFTQPGVQQTGTPLLQINTQFVDPCTRQIMSVTVYYQGVAVASGQLTSTSPVQSYVYNPGCPNQGYFPGQSYPGQSYYPGQTYPSQGYYPGQTTYYYQQPYTTYYVR